MKILVLSQYFWPENFRINDLVIGLKERGHSVEVLTGIPNYPHGKYFHGYSALNKSREIYNGITVHRAPMSPRGSGSGFRLALNFISFALFSSIFGPIFCRKRYDIIFVYEPSPITVAIPAIIMKIFTSAPIVFWMQDLWPESLSATDAIRSKTVLKLVELLVRLIYKGCDRILIQSEAFKPSIIHQGGEPDRIFYYPNSADSLYQPVPFPSDGVEKSLVPDGFRVVFAGNIGAAQDFQSIISAADMLKHHKDIHWIILGDGRMSNWVQSEADKRGLSDTFHLLGSYPSEAMPRFFALSDVLLVTLKKEPIFALTIPSKIQSYLACAKPIVAALDGEGARIIDEAGAGITCPAQNPAALSSAVMRVYDMTQQERDDLGANGRKYFENHFERELLLERLIVYLSGLKSEARE